MAHECDLDGLHISSLGNSSDFWGIAGLSSLSPRQLPSTPTSTLPKVNLLLPVGCPPSATSAKPYLQHECTRRRKANKCLFSLNLTPSLISLIQLIFHCYLLKIFVKERESDPLLTGINPMSDTQLNGYIPKHPDDLFSGATVDNIEVYTHESNRSIKMPCPSDHCCFMAKSWQNKNHFQLTKRSYLCLSDKKSFPLAIPS